ncbi:hypothetical protein N7G274_003625 [Stereocaulon virgatum]|uniref:Uncharacterized protein n=1 Tax=Stereocaulon virgatum TaxID=373712 RepID=A0ABR4ABS9_9LECA
MALPQTPYLRPHNSINDEDVDAEPFLLDKPLRTYAPIPKFGKQPLEGQNPLRTLIKLRYSDAPRNMASVPQWLCEWELKWKNICDQKMKTAISKL